MKQDSEKPKVGLIYRDYVDVDYRLTFYLLHIRVMVYFQIDPNAKKLYVGNISYETTRDDLIEFFGEYGEVKDVYVPVDRDTGAPRGFAFVTMNAEEAEKAIEDASGVVLQGRTIDVKESLPRGQKAAPRQKPSSKYFSSA